jgi:DSF synthase
MAKDPIDRCHNFSLPLLHALQEFLQTVVDEGATWQYKGKATPIHYAVLKSGDPDYFSLGGDLQHFRACIDRRDRQSLYDYSRLCLEIMYKWATGLNGRTTTISLVQGRALGGGFETALSADFLIAEEQSEFGFPEIMFGLFPCTGGMSLLTRRVGVYAAERMMTNGRIYSASELKEMGVVDEVCPKGHGAAAAEKFIAAHSKRRMARLMLQRGRQRLSPLNLAELQTVVDEWVETAMHLGDDDLKVMDMLIRMQEGVQRRA